MRGQKEVPSNRRLYNIRTTLGFRSVLVFPTRGACAFRVLNRLDLSIASASPDWALLITWDTLNVPAGARFVKPVLISQDFRYRSMASFGVSILMPIWGRMVLYFTKYAWYHSLS